MNQGNRGSTSSELLVLQFARNVSREAIAVLGERSRGQGLDLRVPPGTGMAFARLPFPAAGLLKDLQANSSIARAWVQQVPWILAGRDWQEEDTCIEVRGRRIGGGGLSLIAGPCSVESATQLSHMAHVVGEAGADFLRAGAFKPRSNPYDFQGLRKKGLEYLRETSRESGLPVITEVMSVADLDAVAEHCDVIQVGARLCQHFDLLHELGRIGKPVLLKRGFGSTLDELLLAAEHILSSGNPRVMLCERGIRSFEHAARFTFDLNAIPILKSLTHLPVVADPSHATGDRRFVPAVARGAVAAGADALMVEVHADPEEAFSDGAQSLEPAAFRALVNDLELLLPALGRPPLRGKRTPASPTAEDLYASRGR